MERAMDLVDIYLFLICVCCVAFWLTLERLTKSGVAGVIAKARSMIPEGSHRHVYGRVRRRRIPDDNRSPRTAGRRPCRDWSGPSDRLPGRGHSSRLADKRESVSAASGG